MFTLYLTFTFHHKGPMSDFTLIYRALFPLLFDWEKMVGRKHQSWISLIPNTTNKSSSETSYLVAYGKSIITKLGVHTGSPDRPMSGIYMEMCGWDAAMKARKVGGVVFQNQIHSCKTVT